MNISRGQLFTFAAVGFVAAFVGVAYISSREEELDPEEPDELPVEEINSPKPQALSFNRWLTGFPGATYSKEIMEAMTKGYALYLECPDEPAYREQCRHINTLIQTAKPIKIGNEYRDLLIRHKAAESLRWLDNLSASLGFNKGQIPLDDYLKKITIVRMDRTSFTPAQRAVDQLIMLVGPKGVEDYLKKEISVNNVIPFPFISIQRPAPNSEEIKTWMAKVERGEKDRSIVETAILIHCLDIPGEKEAKKWAGQIVKTHLINEAIPLDFN